MKYIIRIWSRSSKQLVRSMAAGEVDLCTAMQFAHEKYPDEMFCIKLFEITEKEVFFRVVEEKEPIVHNNKYDLL